MIETFFLNRVSDQLRNFKKTHDNTYNFSCPICGDSQKNKNKARGYLYPSTDGSTLIYFCHNCETDKGMDFGQFLKAIGREDVYNEYKVEKYLTKDQLKEKLNLPTSITKEVKTNECLKSIKKVSSLSPLHPCKQFVMQRRIPSNFHYRLYYAENFKKFVDLATDSDSKYPEDQRLVIPFFNDNTEMICLQGRVIGDSKHQKYYTVTFMKGHTKVFNIDKTNFNNTYYVFEGPIDAMYIPNSVSGISASTMVNNIEKLDRCVSNAVYVFDNQPRNKQITETILSAIQKGHKVVIWPRHIDFPYKDVGSFIEQGLSTLENDVEHIKRMIDDHTFQGLQAELEFGEWCKCET